MSAAAFFRRPAVVLILGLCLIGGGISLLSRLVSKPSAEPKRVVLPHQSGAETAPAFSPDGKRLAFSARESGRTSPYHIYARTLAGGAAAQLTMGGADDFGPVWSPDGSIIAFLRVEENRARYMAIPASGGEPRPVADFPLPDPAPCRTRAGEVETSADCGSRPGPQPSVSWTRDGQSLYIVAWADAQPTSIVAVPAAGGTPRRITQPPDGSHGDSFPAISPDGRMLAFVRQSTSETAQKHGRTKFAMVRQSSTADERDGSDIYLSDLSGNGVRRLTFDNVSIHGIAWSADGRDLIYAARRLDQDKLWRVAASGGSSRNVLASGKHMAFPAIAPAGRRLAFVETPELDWIWRIDLTAPDPAATARLLIHSSGREYWPSWSPDGKRISDVSTDGDSPEVWLCDADGNHRAPITHLRMAGIDQPRWSPDGSRIVFDVRGDGAMDVDQMASDGRTPPQRIPLPGDSREVTWSHDGNWIYFQSMAQLWKARADGQQRQKLTNNWGDGEPEESADGQYVFFRRERAIWRVPAAGGAEEKVIAPERDSRWTGYQPAAAGLYYLELDRNDRTIALRFYGFVNAKSRELVRLPVTDVFSVRTFNVSPDGRFLLYPAVDHDGTRLVLTENFR